MISIWHLNRVDWLRDLPTVASKRLQESATVLELSKGEIVFTPSKRPRFVFLLERGLVRIYRTGKHGKQVAYGYVREGEVFGELPVFAAKPRESFAETVRRSVVWKIPIGVFRDVLRSSPDIVFEVARQVEGRFKSVESRVEDLVFRDVRSRLARILLEIAEDFGEEVNGETVVRFPASQQDLAVLIGSTRQSVGEALRSMESEGVLKRVRTRLRILAPERLASIAEGPAAS